jgi:hypothetical protein
LSSTITDVPNQLDVPLHRGFESALPLFVVTFFPDTANLS